MYDEEYREDMEGETPMSVMQDLMDMSNEANALAANEVTIHTYLTTEDYVENGSKERWLDLVVMVSDTIAEAWSVEAQ